MKNRVSRSRGRALGFEMLAMGWETRFAEGVGIKKPREANEGTELISSIGFVLGPVQVELAMLKIRNAVPDDIPLVLSFIRELAEYERAPDPVSATEDDLRRDGFTTNPKFRVIIAELDGKPAGMAFFFYHYSTWKGRPGLYLEDLFVRPEFRSRGVGKALMVHLARIAIAENCYGIRWEVLDWNEPAIQVYQRLGGRFREHWRGMQIVGEDLRRLAGTE